MNSARGLGIAAFCFFTSFGITWLMTKGPAPQPPAHPVTQDSAKPFATTVEPTSIGEAAKSHPVLVMADLRQNPYLTLTDQEIAELGGQMDISKDRNRRLLNNIASMDLRAKLWEAAIRANIGKIPLEQLTEFADLAMTRGEPIYNPIFEELEAKGNVREALATPWGEALSGLYLTYLSGKNGSLADGLSVIPRDKNYQELQQSYVESWIEAHPEPASLKEVFEIPPNESLGTDFYSSIAFTVWSQASADQKGEVLDEIAVLPATQRNRALTTVASAVPRDRPEQLVQILREVSSFHCQQRIVENWLDGNPNTQENLLNSLNSSGERSELAKITESVAEKIASAKTTKK